MIYKVLEFGNKGEKRGISNLKGLTVKLKTGPLTCIIAECDGDSVVGEKLRLC